MPSVPFKSTRVSPGSIAARFSISQAPCAVARSTPTAWMTLPPSTTPCASRRSSPGSGGNLQRGSASAKAPRMQLRSTPVLPPLLRACGRGRSGAPPQKRRTAARRQIERARGFQDKRPLDRAIGDLRLVEAERGGRQVEFPARAEIRPRRTLAPSQRSVAVPTSVAAPSYFAANLHRGKCTVPSSESVAG